MEGIADRIDRALLDNWQRDFPIEPAPFDRLAAGLAITPREVLDRLQRHRANGRITRVGATCAPNTVSASTLAAVAAPTERIEEVAAIISAQPGVNHSYLREHDWNLWFVATGPDRAHVDRTLGAIGAQTGLRVLDLRLVRPFNIDLGFGMRGAPASAAKPRAIDTRAFRDTDRPLLAALMSGMPLVRQPYRALADTLGWTEARVLDRTRSLHDAAIIARLGVIVRHRALGWRANAMVVWDMEPDRITVMGPRLAAFPGVTLCYERVCVPGVWPYRLYTMIHARSRASALETLDQICALPGMETVPHAALFSLRCFKQTGALVAAPQKVPA